MASGEPDAKQGSLGWSIGVGRLAPSRVKAVVLVRVSGDGRDRQGAKPSKGRVSQPSPLPLPSPRQAPN